ncbi:MAG: radical SAM family heme chaperone HemW [Bacteroidota bacterium]
MSSIEHLYFHVPFCTHICPYCAFYKTRNLMSDMRPFIPALKKEIRWHLEHYEIEPLTVYFGGGTPSALSIKQLEDLVADWPWNEIEEFTMECNPETITNKKARLLNLWGVNRISLGVQAFDNHSLKLLGRTHNKHRVQKSVEILREEGFENISIDLMFALPGQTMEAWGNSLQETVFLKPEHVSCYNLNYEEDTVFLERFKRGQYQSNETQEKDFFYRGINALSQAGYQQYEISNYARNGYESKHNQACWSGKDYLGFGPSACSTIGNARWKNIANVHEYSRGWQKGKRLGNSESLDHHIKRNERIILGLRTSRGVEAEYFLGKEQQLKDLVHEGLMIEIDGGHHTLTNRGKLVADSITELLVG